MKFFIIFFSVIFLFNSEKIYSQGCSDAGVCSIHSLKPELEIPFTKNQFTVGLAYGKGDSGINVVNPYIEYNRSLNRNWSVNGKINFQSNSGTLASVSGFSDALLSVTYSSESNLSFTLGAKIPLNKSDKTENGLPLPMAYQNSLGTFDLIFGIGYKYNNLGIFAGYQKPLSQNNNRFFSSDYPANSLARGFPSTNKFERESDVIFRITYQFKASDNFYITPGILPVIHVGDDHYTDKQGQYIKIDSSAGLTLNVNLFMNYILDENSSLVLSYGMPLVSRKVRPDGLTRKFAVSLDYKYSF